jgi:rhodanese-related sulfurtransferase
VDVIPASEVDERLQHAVLLDVRKPAEIAESGTLAGAILIPIDELPGRLDELPRDRPILTA